MPTKCPACSQPGTERSNPQGEAWDGELVSRNTSELDSASLNDIVGMAKLPGELKPAIIGEETLTCNRWIPRGDWRQRARKEKSRNLGGPGRALSTARESDGLIVVKKGLIHLERRGPTVGAQLWKRKHPLDHLIDYGINATIDMEAKSEMTKYLQESRMRVPRVKADITQSARPVR